MRGAEAWPPPVFDGSLLLGLDRYSTGKQWNRMNQNRFGLSGATRPKNQFRCNIAAFQPHYLRRICAATHLKWNYFRKNRR
jgi:hypothetical protein